MFQWNAPIFKVTLLLLQTSLSTSHGSMSGLAEPEFIGPILSRLADSQYRAEGQVWYLSLWSVCLSFTPTQPRSRHYWHLNAILSSVHKTPRHIHWASCTPFLGASSGSRMFRAGTNAYHAETERLP